MCIVGRVSVPRLVNDLVLGVRLAVGSGRNSLVRLALTAIGVGLGVMVLLVAASVPHMIDARNERGSARTADSSQPVPGVDPVYAVQRSDEFQGRGMQGYLVAPTGPRAPHAPGVDRLPGPGQAVLSPALVQLLESPEGEMLRPRFTQQIIGTVGPDGLTGPNELYFYIGSDSASAMPDAARISQFGTPWAGRGLTTVEWLLIVLGATSFLIPVIVFVATSTRLAASVRDRRLAALRLIGAGSAQVRRIAAGEAFVGAVAGLFLGLGLFFLVRSLVPMVTVSAFRGGIFASDVRPDWRLAVLIAAGLPALAVTIATMSLRRTIIEPLGVVRRASTAPRILWWRLILPLAGGTLLLVATDGRRFPLIAGITLLLLSVPVLLPWIVELVTNRINAGGSPAFQLAVRRLQMDTGTAARVVAGVAVVLAGAIALQTVYERADKETTPPGQGQISASYFANSLAQIDAFASAIHSIDGLAHVPISTTGRVVDSADEHHSIVVESCASIRVRPCVDGDVFASPSVKVSPGEAVWFGEHRAGAPQWTIPRLTRIAGDDAQLVITPGALASAGQVALYSNTHVPATGDPALIEQMRNAVGRLGWSGVVYSQGTSRDANYLLISRILQIGAFITLLIAIASLIVVALEQMRERRRSLAVLTANGVPRSILARALLWQTSIPVAVAVAVATVAGLALAAMLLTATGRPVDIDWTTVALFGGVALGSVLLVTALTLPALWQATSTTALREV
ncbi:FtsX-like permease family protein [Kibdelosporangium aridum]|uniref:FtsX-like permease family protein n=1 Tax=Kibdelosporangium aridum TaxID=2030 RepID=A0A1Y5Y4R4_KIBAR|nr:FtsX-like permease family protein [Kibdelosporangium aridum]